MPKTNRPPQVKARMEATKRLIEGHATEYDQLIEEVLAEWGWEKKTVTQDTWVNNGGGGNSDD